VLAPREFPRELLAARELDLFLLSPPILATRSLVCSDADANPLLEVPREFPLRTDPRELLRLELLRLEALLLLVLLLETLLEAPREVFDPDDFLGADRDTVFDFDLDLDLAFPELH